MKNFKAPRKALTGLDAESVAALITGSTDIALVLDAGGNILDMACGSDEFAAELEADWIGKNLLETVAVDSKPKVPLLLADAVAPQAGARQLNHLAAGGVDGTIAVSYTLRRLGEQRLIALGRDLRALASLQQRLIEAEQSLERDYSRLRLAEARYRLLSQSVQDAVLVIDASTYKILEANPAAENVFASKGQRFAGKPMGELLHESSREAFLDWIALLRRAGRAEDLVVALGTEATPARLYGVPFRQENASNVMLRIDLPRSAAAAPRSRLTERLHELIQVLPDALVLTNPEGRVLVANGAFLDMAQLTSEEQARNETLDRWLGRPGVDLGVLLANLRQSGSLRLFATTLRGEHGATAEVEISAVALAESVEPCLGFAIRNVDRRRSSVAKAGREIPRSVEQLTELVGRVSLKELVRETTDVIERLCIEAALNLTGDNRASAAEMLGLSRQSLYVKLRRYGLGDLGAGEVT